MGIKILAVVTLVLLVGCGEPAPPTAQSIALDKRLLSERYIKAGLKDGSSAKFREQSYKPGGAACGEVNAKNAFGAYTGFHSYIFISPQIILTEQDTKSADFVRVWNQHCR